MARTRTSRSQAIVRAVPVPVRAPAPIIRIAQPRAPAKPKKAHRRKSVGAGSTKNTMIGSAIGGAVLGFVEKTFPNLPTMPLIGRAGTIAIGAYLLSGRGGSMGTILRDVAIAGSVIAGYQLGKDGKVSGDDDVSGDLAEQVRGIATQV